MPDPFEEAVAATVRRGRLFRKGDRVVVAFSGGPDSTALLLALHALGVPLVAAHLDHGLRPGSGGDAAAARRLARSLRVPFRSARLRGLRKRARGSLERAARAERYAFLARVARREKAAAVAVAHHRDDRAETVLHRLLQGGALPGLAGIPLRRPLPGAPGCPVVRPLFDVDRAAVESYLRDRGVAAREDPTNGDGSNARSRLRHRVLPAVLAEYPGARASLLRLADTAREASRILDAGAASAAAGWEVGGRAVRAPRSDFEGLTAAGARRLLGEALRAAGCGRTDPPRAAVERFLAAIGERDGRTRGVPIRGGVEARVGPGIVEVRRA
jgi:tRNA(Ile)-lysidine synthase